MQSRVDLLDVLAYDCGKLIFIRSGSAVLLSEFGEKPVDVGDVNALAANTLCSSEPEGSITVTTVYLDRDYVVDQVFWQHAALLSDRVAAQDLADELYSELPAARWRRPTRRHSRHPPEQTPLSRQCRRYSLNNTECSTSHACHTGCSPNVLCTTP